MTDFRVINDEDDGQLKDGDVVIEMVLREGAPLPEPVEEGRIHIEKGGNHGTPYQGRPTGRKYGALSDGKSRERRVSR